MMSLFKEYMPKLNKHYLKPLLYFSHFTFHYPNRMGNGKSSNDICHYSYAVLFTDFNGDSYKTKLTLKKVHPILNCTMKIYRVVDV
jgi:hypothetical protein